MYLGHHHALSGVTGGSFAGELRYKAPVAAHRRRYQTSGADYTRCRGSATGGAATAANLERFQPGGDLEYMLTAPLEVIKGNICLHGSETVQGGVVTAYENVQATPGGWFLYHAGGGVSRVLNPPASWGAPSSDESRGSVTLTGRRDDRSLPWALELDSATETGSLYFEPTAPLEAAERTGVETIGPGRVAELREAAEEARRVRAGANGAPPNGGPGAIVAGAELAPGALGLPFEISPAVIAAAAAVVFLMFRR